MAWVLHTPGRRHVCPRAVVRSTVVIVCGPKRKGRCRVMTPDPEYQSQHRSVKYEGRRCRIVDTRVQRAWSGAHNVILPTKTSFLLALLLALVKVSGSKSALVLPHAILRTRAGPARNVVERGPSQLTFPRHPRQCQQRPGRPGRGPGSSSPDGRARAGPRPCSRGSR